jgi:hypothetical protein
MKNFLLHPLTHEVYDIADECIAHNFGTCIGISFAEFERIASQGTLSAERIVAHANERHGTLHFHQVAFVRVSKVNEEPRYAWASRIRVDRLVVPPSMSDLMTNEDMGAEFLWLWPPCAAMNAFVTYKERNRLSMTNTTMLDHYEPSVSHYASTPGAQIGPDDVPSATHVPLDELTPEQRFFVACIKPQRTLFRRRRTTDQWTRDVQRADAMANERNQRNEPAVQLLNRKRELEFWCGSEPLPKRVFCSALQADWFAQRTAGDFGGFEFHALPFDISNHILCTALATAMTDTTNVAAETCLSLRAVCKDFRDATEQFVQQTVVRARGKAISMLATGKRYTALGVGTQARSIGLTVRMLLALRVDAPYAPEQPLRTLREYLLQRHEFDKHACAHAHKLVSATQAPSRVWSTIAPATRDSRHLHVNPEYDALIARSGSVSVDLAAALVEEVRV